MADAQAEAKAEEEAAAKLEAEAASKGEAEKADAEKAATEQAKKVAADKKAEAEKKAAAKKAEADKKNSKEKKLLAKADEMAADPEEAKFPTDWIKNDVKFNVDDNTRNHNREDAVEAAVRQQATWKTSTEGWFLQTKAFLLRRWGNNAPGPA